MRTIDNSFEQLKRHLQAEGLFDAARKRGIDVTADCYPWDAWSSTILVLIPNKKYDDPQSVARGLAYDPLARSNKGGFLTPKRRAAHPIWLIAVRLLTPVVATAGVVVVVVVAAPAVGDVAGIAVSVDPQPASIMAHAMMGNGDRAGELFAMLNPVNHSLDCPTEW